MLRHRLRLLLQELDLPLGATVIGRDVDCHVTLDDPLVSRRHARILVGCDRVVVEDLGSRNGLLVNGAIVRGPRTLQDGDRLRIGVQHLVYYAIDEDRAPASMPSRKTGQLGLCAACQLPYAREAPACPSCEGTDQLDEDTLVEPKGVPRSSGMQRSAAGADHGSSASHDDVSAEITGGVK